MKCVMNRQHKNKICVHFLIYYYEYAASIFSDVQNTLCQQLSSCMLLFSSGSTYK